MAAIATIRARQEQSSAGFHLHGAMHERRGRVQYCIAQKRELPKGANSLTGASYSTESIRFTRIPDAAIALRFGLRQREEESGPMTRPFVTRPFGHFTYNKLALLLLLCAVAFGGTVLVNRASLYSAPHAAEISGMGHVRDLPPLW
ncbi:MAG TPA: hypothetical protein VH678_00235 [Xanthobacteraceae bacterium]